MDNAPKIDDLGEEISAEEMKQSVNLRAGYKHPFPYVSINSRGYIYFNSAALPFINGSRYCKVYFTTEHVILKLTNNPNGAFKLSKHKEGGITCLVTELKSRVKPGQYKLYRSADGYAIKRHEPLKRKEG